MFIFILGKYKSATSQSINTKTSSSTDAASIYSFPEPTMQIKVTHFSHDTETEFIIDSDIYDPKDTSVSPILNWFYQLELKACEKPDNTIENEYYDFVINGKFGGFRYEIQDEQAFIIVRKQWYEIKNPSIPPVEWEALSTRRKHDKKIFCTHFIQP